jgi:hypothetical protein
LQSLLSAQHAHTYKYIRATHRGRAVGADAVAVERIGALNDVLHHGLLDAEAVRGLKLLEHAAVVAGDTGAKEGHALHKVCEAVRRAGALGHITTARELIVRLAVAALYRESANMEDH